ncbi:MAG: NAD(P)/FAD-dependent oxidoreductase, partial [Wenzhouxiangellaceae bacterium]
MNGNEYKRHRFHTPAWYRHVLGADGSAPALQGSHRVETLVIGAGLAGLSTALGLAERDRGDVLVIDRGAVGEGASGRNGGFVFAGFSLDNEALARQVGPERARRMHGWTREAVALIRRRCDDWKVPVSDAPVLLADWFDDAKRLAAFRDRMAAELDFRLDWIAAEDLPQYVRSARYGAGLIEPGSFHFNPLEYARAVAGQLRRQGATVAGNSPALRMQRIGKSWQVETPQAEIRAERVVLATGGYERKLIRRVQRAIQPIATYIMVTEPLGERLRELIPAGVAVYDTRFAFDYYRPLPDGRLLWGGRISIADRDPQAIRRLLYRDMLRVFPSLEGCRIDFA